MRKRGTKGYGSAVEPTKDRGCNLCIYSVSLREGVSVCRRYPPQAGPGQLATYKLNGFPVVFDNQPCGEFCPER